MTVDFTASNVPGVPRYECGRCHTFIVGPLPDTWVTVTFRGMGMDGRRTLCPGCGCDVVNEVTRPYGQAWKP